MMEVNSTNTITVFMCWLPFKVEVGEGRESEKGRVSTLTSAFVSQTWIWCTSKVDSGQWIRVVSQSAPGMASTTFFSGLLARLLKKFKYHICKEKKSFFLTQSASSSKTASQ